MPIGAALRAHVAALRAGRLLARHVLDLVGLERVALGPSGVLGAAAAGLRERAGRDGCGVRLSTVGARRGRRFGSWRAHDLVGPRRIDRARRGRARPPVSSSLRLCTMTTSSTATPTSSTAATPIKHDQSRGGAPARPRAPRSRARAPRSRRRDRSGRAHRRAPSVRMHRASAAAGRRERSRHRPIARPRAGAAPLVCALRLRRHRARSARLTTRETSPMSIESSSVGRARRTRGRARGPSLRAAVAATGRAVRSHRRTIRRATQPRRRRVGASSARGGDRLRSRSNGGCRAFERRCSVVGPIDVRHRRRRLVERPTRVASRRATAGIAGTRARDPRRVRASRARRSRRPSTRRWRRMPARRFSSDAIVAANSGFGSSSTRRAIAAAASAPGATRGSGGGAVGARRLLAQPAEVADLVDRQPVVEAFAPAVQLGVERLARDPALRLGERERPRLLAVDRDVPLLFERRRAASRRCWRERRCERAAGARALVGCDRCARSSARPRLGSASVVRGHALANGDHVRAVLAADLEDLAANAVVPDRVAGLAAVAEKLHAHARRCSLLPNETRLCMPQRGTTALRSVIRRSATVRRGYAPRPGCRAPARTVADLRASPSTCDGRQHAAGRGACRRVRCVRRPPTSIVSPRLDELEVEIESLQRRSRSSARSSRSAGRPARLDDCGPAWRLERETRRGTRSAPSRRRLRVIATSSSRPSGARSGAANTSVRRRAGSRAGLSAPRRGSPSVVAVDRRRSSPERRQAGAEPHASASRASTGAGRTQHRRPWPADRVARDDERRSRSIAIEHGAELAQVASARRRADRARDRASTVGCAERAHELVARRADVDARTRCARPRRRRPRRTTPGPAARRRSGSRRPRRAAR